MVITASAVAIGRELGWSEILSSAVHHSSE